MRTVYKYPLEVTDEQTVFLPRDFRLLTAQFQGPTLCVWAEVDPDAPDVPLVFRVVGTGNPFEDAAECEYLATAQDPTGKLVWHVYHKCG